MKMKKWSVISCLLTTICAYANAAPLPTEGVKDDSQWRVMISPYIWGESLKGNVGVDNHDAQVKMPFHRVVRDLNFGWMGNIELDKGQYGAYLDNQYSHIRQNGEIENIGVGTSGTITQIRVGGFYRAYQADLAGKTVFQQPQRLTIEPTAGLLWSKLTAKINALSQSLSDNQNWFDPFIGSRFSYDLSPRWNLSAEGDVGGFGLGSRIMLDGQAYLGYRISLFGQPTMLRAGYRALHQNFAKTNFHWDVTQYGPVLGASMWF